MSKPMETVPNQKVVLVQKQECNKENYYSVINLDSIDYAAGKLDNVAFKLWLYIAKNQNNYQFALSAKAFMDWCGTSKPTYLKAVKTLEDKRFLVPKAANSNHYVFYEKPGDNIPYPEDEDDIRIEFGE